MGPADRERAGAVTASALMPARWAQTGAARYPIHIGPGLLERIGELWAERGPGSAVLLVSDTNLAEPAARLGVSLESAGLRVVDAPIRPGEGSKTLAELERLCRRAAAGGLRRSDAVVALGGGVVGDLAGFAAASYQRGIRLVHAPTTLLAMVDSSIGGKTGVDLPEGKNYVGAIWQPDMVVMDTDLLSTLPARELSCGFAEVVKYGLLSGADFAARVQEWPALPGPVDELTALIRACIDHKLDVVAEDERDRGLRASLNLGHTVGHGIEAAAGYDRYRHGEAIALGLLAALRLSEETVGLDPVWRERTAAVLSRHDLPTRLAPEVATGDILAAIARDKKADATALNMVMVAAPGDVRLHVSPPHERLVAAIEELRA